MFTLIVTFYLLPIKTASKACFDGGNFVYVDNTCLFECYSDNTLHNLTELEWSEFTDQYYCNQIVTAEQIGLCHDIEDLVFITDRFSCMRCPAYCKCNDTSVTIASEQIKYQKQCNECNCVNIEDNTFGLECAITNSISGAAHWNEQLMCPNPNICYTPNFAIQLPGDGWWEASERFCFCKYNEGVKCIDGYSNIGNTDDEEFLYDGFYPCCSYMNRDPLWGEDLGDCFYEPERWVGTLCPTCDCGKHTVGDDWFSETVQPWFAKVDAAEWFGSLYCYHCRCVVYVDPFDPDNTYEYTNCSLVNTYFQGSGEQCPPDRHKKCYSASSNNKQYQSMDIETSIDAEYQHCGWQYDTVDNLAKWGPMHMSLCDRTDIMENQCYYYNISINITTCYGSIQETYIKYWSCCSIDLCNNQDVEIDSCIEIKDEYFQIMDPYPITYYTCIYDTDYLCNVNHVYMTLNCSGIREIGTLYMKCQCESWSYLYQNMKDVANKQNIKACIHWTNGYLHLSVILNLIVTWRLVIFI